jgi:small subunit ribosomal protein S18
MKRMSGSGSGRGRGSSRDRMKKPRFKNAEDGMPIIMRKRFCRFCKDKVDYIDYKDLHILEKLIGERGKISSRRSTGTCAKHQRVVAAAIKRARFLSLIPYIR